MFSKIPAQLYLYEESFQVFIGQEPEQLKNILAKSGLNVVLVQGNAFLSLRRKIQTEAVK
jgi:hypothetical protein